MLDIGFSEIVLIFGLALVVLGPEKLPKVASQVGRWIGRARGMARQFREQLEEEVNLEEVRKTRPPVMTSDPSRAVTSLVATTEPPSAMTSPVATTDSPPPAADPEQPVYPDGYSHAHPTDSLGRPIEQLTPESAAVDSGQQDWVGGVTASDKAAQTTPAAAYAPSHERGT